MEEEIITQPNTTVPTAVPNEAGIETQENEYLRIYDYCKRNWNDTVESVSLLYEEKDAMLAKNIELIEEIYSALEPIYEQVAYLEVSKQKTAQDETDKQIIKMLSHYIVYWFLLSPESEDIRKALLLELRMISAGIGLFKGGKNFKPYTLIEFKEIINGEGLFYNDAFFANTLNHIMKMDQNDEYISALIASLPASSYEIKDCDKLYTWEEAFLLVLIAHTCWNAFPKMPPREQQILLKNFFYHGIVMGIPIREYLSACLRVEPTYQRFEATANFISRALADSNEFILIDLTKKNSERFNSLIEKYSSVVYGENIDLIAQEQFISEIYKGQEEKEIYLSWLREALSIILLLRKKELYK
ncbi:MAG: hypothetical protein ABH832_02005 [bacterium]